MSLLVVKYSCMLLYHNTSPANNMQDSDKFAHIVVFFLIVLGSSNFHVLVHPVCMVREG